jgi:hypothetical protein
MQPLQSTDWTAMFECRFHSPEETNRLAKKPVKTRDSRRIAPATGLRAQLAVQDKREISGKRGGGIHRSCMRRFPCLRTYMAYLGHERCDPYLNSDGGRRIRQRLGPTQTRFSISLGRSDRPNRTAGCSTCWRTRRTPSSAGVL